MITLPFLLSCYLTTCYPIAICKTKINGHSCSEVLLAREKWQTKWKYMECSPLVKVTNLQDNRSCIRKSNTIKPVSIIFMTMFHTQQVGTYLNSFVWLRISWLGYSTKSQFHRHFLAALPLAADWERGPGGRRDKGLAAILAAGYHSCHPVSWHLPHLGRLQGTKDHWLPLRSHILLSIFFKLILWTIADFAVSLKSAKSQIKQIPIHSFPLSVAGMLET